MRKMTLINYTSGGNLCKLNKQRAQNQALGDTTLSQYNFLELFFVITVYEMTLMTCCVTSLTTY